MCFIRLFSEVRVSIDKEYNCKSASKNPVQYFNIIMDVSSLCYKMVIFKRVWFNQEDFLHVLLYIQGKNHLRVRPSSVQVIFQKNISKFCKYKFKYTCIFLISVISNGLLPLHIFRLYHRPRICQLLFWKKLYRPE